MIICFKIDLALNNPQWLICHKPHTTNQPTNQRHTFYPISNKPYCFIIANLQAYLNNPNPVDVMQPVFFNV